MSQHSFFTYLEQRLRSDLPGREAQLKMSPKPLDPDVVLPLKKTTTSTPSSVLIPLYTDENNELQTIFTLRTNRIRHAGQISFPGGRKENNETLKEAALRETEEEIGVEQQLITVPGSISPLYLHRTDNQITPFVGFMRQKPEMTLNPYEVEEAFSCSLNKLCNNQSVICEEWTLNDNTFRVPYWDIHRVPLWGATAMILSELLVLYREFLNEKKFG